jgi:hypothetical protein
MTKAIRSIEGATRDLRETKKKVQQVTQQAEALVHALQAQGAHIPKRSAQQGAKKES